MQHIESFNEFLNLGDLFTSKKKKLQMYHQAIGMLNTEGNPILGTPKLPTDTGINLENKGEYIGILKKLVKGDKTNSSENNMIKPVLDKIKFLNKSAKIDEPLNINLKKFQEEGQVMTGKTEEKPYTNMKSFTKRVKQRII